MAWWTNPNIQLKQKNRFIMSIGEFLIPTVVSVDKPKVQIDSKEYTMINHVYRYPGIAKWQPITVTFVDGSGNSLVRDLSGFSGDAQVKKLIPGIDDLDAAQMLYKMLLGSGYYFGETVYGATSKTDMKNNSLGTSVRIEQIEPDGKTVSEGWRLHNPIFTEISWGNLSYADDTAVEYSLTIAYDWAEFYIGGDASLGSPTVQKPMRKQPAEFQSLLDKAKERDIQAEADRTELERREAARLATQVARESWSGGVDVEQLLLEDF